MTSYSTMMLSRVVVSVAFVLFCLSAATAIGGSYSIDDPSSLDQYFLPEKLALPPLPPGIDPSKLEFRLAMFWPQGFCRGKDSGCENKVNDVPHDFIVHGLWPIYRGKCTDSTEAFSYDKVKHLEPGLSLHWPYLKKFKNQEAYRGFWEHEWNDHGKKCNLYDVKEYFSDSLDLLRQSNVKQAIKNAGFPTKPEDLKKAFPGKEPYMLCKKDKNGKTSYLFELDFCLDHNFEYFNCPKKSQSSFCKDGETFSYGDTTATISKPFENILEEIKWLIA